MDYGEVLSRAWQIIWKHKVLWIFGILASCSGGGGGGGGGNTGYQFSDEEFRRGAERFFQFQIEDWQIGLFVAFAVLLILLIILIVVVLATVGRIGLIQGTLQSETGSQDLRFSALFQSSLSYFWRVLGLNLFVGLIAIVAVLVPIAITLGTAGLALICLIPLLCLIVPAVWLVQVVIEQAIIAIVVEDLGIMDGLQVGWEVFRANLGTMIVMALILLLAIGGIGGFLIALPILLIIAPAVIAAASGAILDSPGVIGGGLLIAGLCFLAYIPVMIVLNGILRSYIGTAWTLTYLRLRPQSAQLSEEMPVSVTS